MNNTIYCIAVIAIISIITWGLRAFPFLLFGNRPLPKIVQYLGKVLPPTIMTILVIYCLRDINIARFPYGFSEIVSCLLVIFIQIIRKNMYLSIIIGTACYMILIRIVWMKSFAEFDTRLFYALVDRVKVNKNEIKIIWKDGTESWWGTYFFDLENYHHNGGNFQNLYFPHLYGGNF